MSRLLELKGSERPDSLSNAKVFLLSWLFFDCLASGPVFANPIECNAIMQNYLAGKSQIVDRQINSYLAQAAQKGCVEFVPLLLKDGASVHARRREGDTALHHAVRAPKPETTRQLLDAGADIEQRDLAGSTPLTMAIEAGRDATVSLLLERGVDPSRPGRSLATPIAIAAFYGRENIVQLLLDRKVDASLADNTGKTAVVYASARGFTAIVARLLEAGVDVNARYGSELTALIWAAGHSNDVPVQDGVRTVTLLLQRGASINAVDDRGRTALMTAAELGHSAIIELLIAKGATRDIRDKDGKAAKDIAITPVQKLL